MTRDDLALVPRASRGLARVELARVRGTLAWNRLDEAIRASPRGKVEYAELREACFDVASVDGPASILLAVPDRATQSRNFAVLLRLARPIEPSRVERCVRFLTGPDQPTTSISYLGTSMWTGAPEEVGDQRVVLALIDPRTVVLSTLAWARQVVDAAGRPTAPSARQNADLVALVKRTRPGSMVWGVAEIPDEAREGFASIPFLAELRTARALSISIDLQRGFSLELRVDTAGAAEVPAIVASATALLGQAKAAPMVAMLGFSPYLDAVKVRSEGAAFVLTAELAPQRTDELIARIVALVRSSAAAPAVDAPPAESAPAGPPGP